jgi:CheY-like chemotaxis protein
MRTDSRPRVFLVHWKQAEAPERLARLEAAGFAADGGEVGTPELRALRADPPDAVVVDLSRLPSHGRDVALALRTSPKTRHVPIAFVEGAPEKVERVRRDLPDATFGTWRSIVGTLKRARAAARSAPARVAPAPANALAGYSGTPLPKKLGVKPDGLVRLVDGPQGFEAVLGDLPAGARVTRRGTKQAPTVTLWFVSTAAALAHDLERTATLAGDGFLWICWPKKASGVPSEVGDREVRAAGLAAGLVDSKVAAIDATWSGLRFTWRR